MAINGDIKMLSDYISKPNFIDAQHLEYQENIWEICSDSMLNNSEYEYVEIFVENNAYTIDAINMLLKAGVKTNIHYVLGNNSIDEAILRLTNNLFPSGINAVIFLLFKPVGLGKDENCLKAQDPRVTQFFELINTGKFPFKVGFDSCTSPAIINLTNNINPMTFDTCEGGRFSMYISADMYATPCSFDQELKYGISLNNNTIQEAWNSEKFEEFRQHLATSCPACKKRDLCMGGCPIVPQIVLCDKSEKNIVVNV
jgi:radical SAM protein with 4Fe4S-binding SPASM domain